MRDLSKRMVCVICERTYLTEEQAAEAGAKIKQQEQSTSAVAKEKQESKQQLEHHVSKPVVVRINEVTCGDKVADECLFYTKGGSFNSL